MPSIPIGKINHEGKLLTGPEDIKKLLEKEYSERLRPRPTHPHLRHLDKIKLEAFEIKLKEAKLKKSDDWTMLELDNVLKTIKKNKSRDPDGLSRSIFHSDCIGSDLKRSLLIFFNMLKTNGIVPEFMKKATISTIPKKGSKLSLKNERGIFLLSSVRTVFMRLLYNTKYDIINENMSESNVGSRKKKSCINHIFVINGIIHETLSSKHNNPLSLRIYDYRQMFDSMSLQEAVSDLYDSGVKDDTLTLLYEANKNIKVKVRTPYGLSAEQTFDKLVLQILSSINHHSFFQDSVLTR